MIIYRMVTHLENLEKSENCNVVGEQSGKIIICFLQLPDNEHFNTQISTSGFTLVSKVSIVARSPIHWKSQGKVRNLIWSGEWPP